MRICIAGRTIDLSFGSAANERWAQERFAAFRTRGAVDLTLQVVVASMPMRRVVPGTLAARRHGITAIVGRYFAGTMDERTGVLLLGTLPMIAPFLRVLVSLDLLESGGMLLHASGVRAGRGAWVFPGRSGAGKSTLARRFPRADLLSDEVVAVRLHRGRAEACGTPFPGELGVCGRPGWLPLLGFAFLRGRRTPRLLPLSHPDSVRRLLATTLGGWAHERDVRRLWKAATRLVSVAPCADFGFSESESRRSVLSRLAAWRRPPSRGTRRSPRRRAAR